MPGNDPPSGTARAGRARTIDADFLPLAYARHAGADPLRAHAFFAARSRQDDLAPSRGRREDQAVAPDVAERARLRTERIAALARLSPQLIELAKDPRPTVRGTVARCYSIMAKGGQAPADRQVWRMLLGLARYDIDADVRAAADAALDDLERHGTVARAS